MAKEICIHPREARNRPLWGRRRAAADRNKHIVTRKTVTECGDEGKLRERGSEALPRSAGASCGVSH